MYIYSHFCTGRILSLEIVPAIEPFIYRSVLVPSVVPNSGIFFFMFLKPGVEPALKPLHISVNSDIVLTNRVRVLTTRAQSQQQMQYQAAALQQPYQQYSQPPLKC